MKPLERLTHRVILRRGIVVVAATVVLALLPTSARHVGLDVLAATVIGVSRLQRRRRKQRHRHPAIPSQRAESGCGRSPPPPAATRWPDKETVADESQGAQLAKLQELVRYWATDYDWRKGEAKLNAFPQFKTRIDGVDIHFIHVRSRHPNAMPLIITHGWPGSVFEQIKLIGPLTDPTKYGGRAEDAFDVVIPSLPGFGFSERPTEAGWGLERIGSAWAVLMKRLGYTRYVAQGGDWGAGVVEAMGRQAPAGLLGIHTQLPGGDHGRSRSGARRRQVRAGSAVREGRLAQSRTWERTSAERGPLLPRHDGRAAAGRGLRPDRFARRPRRVDARALGVREVVVWHGPQAVANARRRAGQLLACTG